ncbi:hypothetical protein [Sphingomonas pruni]|uniref:hypothetical protein n=1 Tax=Sphingomonas pruni TaxID=40683 RepID=UPI0008354B61|nr:hypothetical protein [Sphingomonas pruni]
MSEGDWFAPKKLGIGAGLPITWQGWAVTIGYSATVIVAAMTLVPRHPGIAAGVIVPLTAAFMVICAQHTRGGWKWRWRGEE